MASQVLTHEQVDALLRKLSTDDGYRKLFQTNLPAAFEQLPGKPALPAGLGQGCCVMPDKLASRETLAASHAAILGKWHSQVELKPHILEEPKRQP